MTDPETNAGVSGVILTESQWRARIVEEAKTWMGTPFHNRAAVKGAGVECGWLIYGVMRDLNILPPGYTMPEYSIQFWMHRDDEVYIKGLLDAGFVEIAPGTIPLPGDVIVAKPLKFFTLFHGAAPVIKFRKDGQ